MWLHCPLRGSKGSLQINTELVVLSDHYPVSLSCSDRSGSGLSSRITKPHHEGSLNEPICKHILYMNICTYSIELRTKPALCLHSTNTSLCSSHLPYKAQLCLQSQDAGFWLERLFHSLWALSPWELITVTSSRPGREVGRTAGKGICTATGWFLWQQLLLGTLAV